MAARRRGKKTALNHVEGFMFDLDGTLLLSDRSLSGHEILPGAIEVLCELKSRGIPFVVLTNGTAYPVAQQAPKLRALGLPIPDEALITPSSVAVDMMQPERFRRTRQGRAPGHEGDRISTRPPRRGP